MNKKDILSFTYFIFFITVFLIFNIRHIFSIIRIFKLTGNSGSLFFIFSYCMNPFQDFSENNMLSYFEESDKTRIIFIITKMKRGSIVIGVTYMLGAIVANILMNIFFP